MEPFFQLHFFIDYFTLPIILFVFCALLFTGMMILQLLPFVKYVKTKFAIV